MTFDLARPFVRLGEAVGAAWSRANFDEAAFPVLATRALEAARLHEGFSPQALLSALLLEDPGYGQNDGTFGEPPIVLYRGRGFYVEALYWLDATTAIHTHAFSGAFQVLHGGSIHARYGFRPEVRVRSTLHFGAVDYHGVEHLVAGDVRPIVAGDGFIHALFHLARPSVSLVVRTVREDDRLPQFNFLPPHVAWDPFEIDRLRDRRAQALNVLYETERDAFLASLEDVARGSDLPALYHALLQLAGRRHDPEALAHLTALARPRHGELADRMLASLLECMRQLHITERRAHATDPHLRWLMALLLNVPQRRDLLRLIEEAGHPDPTEVMIAGLRALVRRPGPEKTTLLDLSVGHDEGGADRVVTILLEAIRGMMADDDVEAIRGRLARATGGLSSQEDEGVPRLVADLRRPTSPFLNLFR